MRVALILTCLDVGGAETQVINLANRLDGSGHQVLVLSMMCDQALLPTRPTIRLEALNIRKNLHSLMLGYIKAGRILREFAPDVVHSHMVHANLFSRLLRLTTRVPRLICTAHNVNEGGALLMLAYRVTDCLAQLTTNVSQEAVDRYIACGAVSASKTMAVHNGIDCDFFCSDPASRARLRADFDVSAGAQVLLAVGRLCEQKDFPNLLHAFAAVCERRDDSLLWIAGIGDAIASLERLAAQLGIGGKVRFLGLRRDIKDLMNAADLFVLSSAYEGFPLVVGEAMACERMVVATDAGGVREWIGRSDHVVPVRDSVALANAISNALAMDEESRRVLGRAARERILARYSLNAAVAKWEQIYKGNYQLDHSSAVKLTRDVK